MSCTTDFDRNGLNDLPLVRGLCLVPMMDFDHDRSQVTNRNKPKVKKTHYLDEGGRICVGHMVNVRMITALG